MDEQHTPQQLSLLPRQEVPLQFRLDQETRRRGLQHIAEIRQLLASRRAASAHTQRGHDDTRRVPVRGRAA